MSKNNIFKNDELRGGDYLMSNNGEWKAVFQEDGNFVIFGWKPTWASDTYGSGAVRLVMQADGNLVLYDMSGQPNWATNTVHKCIVCHLRLTDDGRLVLYQDGCDIWSSDKKP